MNIECGIYTNIGSCNVNEDTAATAEGAISAYILADGLGGHGGGDIASRLVADVVSEIVGSSSELNISLLEHCFTVAQERLIEKQRELHREGAMKTTLVLLLIDSKTAMWGHIGDSRLYHFHRGKIKSRTLDHSVPQMLVRLGQIKEKDIRHHDERNVLLKVMGVPWGSSKMFEIDCRGIKLKKGDTFVLCSDGCWEWVEDKELSRLTKQKKTASEIADDIGNNAYINGEGTERDNITALVVNIR